MLASLLLSILLWASAIPIDTAMLSPFVLPEMLADAAIATALIVAVSFASTSIPPPSVLVVVPPSAVAIVALTTLVILLKLPAPVAATLTAVASGLSATARPIPNASESIRDLPWARTASA